MEQEVEETLLKDAIAAVDVLLQEVSCANKHAPGDTLLLPLSAPCQQHQYKGRGDSHHYQHLRQQQQHQQERSGMSIVRSSRRGPSASILLQSHSYSQSELPLLMNNLKPINHSNHLNLHPSPRSAPDPDNPGTDPSCSGSAVHPEQQTSEDGGGLPPTAAVAAAASGASLQLLPPCRTAKKLIVSTEPALPPQPLMLSRASAIRRRSAAYMVTPEQDHMLARAMERARRMSDTALLSVLGRQEAAANLSGTDGGGVSTTGGGADGTAASLRSIFGTEQHASRHGSSYVALSHAELLHEITNEATTSRPEDAPPSSRSVHGARRSATMRHVDARLGGVVGGGLDKGQTGGGGGRLGTEQGLTLWGGNKSRVERARLAVRLLQATDLSRTKEDKQIDPYAVVSCNGNSYTSKAVMKSKDPFWDEFFVFDVPQPAFAELKVKVYDHLRCWRPVFMGQVRVPVKSIAEFPSRYSQPAWLQMRSRAGKLKGQVQMQLFYTAEWVHRALNVLACTWNVGNAEPPQDLSPWLQGVQALQHDLVAIGVQECLYKVGVGAMDPANHMTEEEYVVEEGARPYYMYGMFDNVHGHIHDGGVFPHPDANAHGHANSHANGYTNSHSHTSASVNGYANGHANGNGVASYFNGGRRKGSSTGSGPADAGLSGTDSQVHGAIPNGHRQVTEYSTPATTSGSGAIAPRSSQPWLSVLIPSTILGFGGGGGGGTTDAADAGGPSAEVFVSTPRSGGTEGSGGTLAQHPRVALTTAATRRRHSLEPVGASRPGLSKSQLHWPHHTVASVNGNNITADGSFSSSAAAAGVAASGASGVAFARTSFTNPTVAGAAAAGQRGNGGGPPGKAGQQTYKSKGVLTDMAKVGGEFRDLWEERLKEAVGPGYFMVAATHMGQIRLLLFARNDVYAAISDVRTSKQATGVAGVATNKGGVGISLKVWETTIAFVNSHLAAHQDRTRARNNNYRDIIRGLKLDGQGSNMDVLTAFHHVIWVGDLNYRLDYGHQAINPTESPLPEDFTSLVAEVQAGAFSKLLEVDQLRREIEAKRTFLGFHEGTISFEPSFKVLRRRGHEYNLQRSPAYCDRILYRSNLPLKQIRVTSYYSSSDISTSDHKPVGAVLVVPTVWRTTVDEDHGTGGLSSTLPVFEPEGGSLGFGYLSRSLHIQTTQPPAQVRLIFTLLHAHGLFMLRSRRRSAVSGSAEFPSPQLLLSAPCMRDPVVRSTVASQTREPLWADEDLEGLGPLVVDLRSASLAEMVHFRLWLRVLDLRGSEKGGSRLGPTSGGRRGRGRGVGEGGWGGATGGKGGKWDARSGDGGGSGGGGKGEGGKGEGAGSGGSGSVLARGVLPLLDAVTTLLQDANNVAPFNVQLELYGLPAGFLEGRMRLEVVDRMKALERARPITHEFNNVYDISGRLDTSVLAQPLRSNEHSFNAPDAQQKEQLSAAVGIGVLDSATLNKQNSSAPSAAAATGTSASVLGGGGGGGFFATLRRSWSTAVVAPQHLPLQAPQPLYEEAEDR